MKLSKAIICSLISVLPLYHACAKGDGSASQDSQASAKIINIEELKSLVDSKTPMALIDARGDKWFDGNLIIGAQRLPSDVSLEAIESTLPDKNELIVVYCGGEQCPASKILAKRLVELGYKNVNDYHGGIKEWTANSYPTEQRQS